MDALRCYGRARSPWWLFARLVEGTGYEAGEPRSGPRPPHVPFCLPLDFSTGAAQVQPVAFWHAKVARASTERAAGVRWNLRADCRFLGRGLDSPGSVVTTAVRYREVPNPIGLPRSAEREVPPRPLRGVGGEVCVSGHRLAGFEFNGAVGASHDPPSGPGAGLTGLGGQEVGVRESGEDFLDGRPRPSGKRRRTRQPVPERLEIPGQPAEVAEGASEPRALDEGAGMV